MHTINTQGVLLFELDEYEWYGHGPSDVQTERQAALRARMRKEAQDARVDAVAAFVTPDALFSAAPVQGRHRVVSEPILGLRGRVKIAATVTIDADEYARADDLFKEYMVLRARDRVLETIGGIDRNRVELRYIVRLTDNGAPQGEILEERIL